MTIVNKNSALRRYAEIPVMCSACGYVARWPLPPAAVQDALISTSYLHEFREELALLNKRTILPKFICFLLRGEIFLPSLRRPLVIESIANYEKRERPDLNGCPACQRACLSLESKFFDELIN